MPFENVYGPGGLLTTVADMLIWNQALDDGRLGRFVTEELQREAIASDGRPIGYARGLFIGDYKGIRMISHGGSTGAYQANLTRYPQERLAFVLLCNADEVGTRGIEDEIVDHHLNLPASPTDLPLGLDLTEKQLAERVGTYASESTGLLVTLSSDGGRLRWNGNRLQAISTSEFRTFGRRVVFSGLNGFDMSVDNIRDRFTKVEGTPPGLSDLSPIAGRYWSDEAATGYVMTVTDGKLKIQNEQRSLFSAEFEPVAKDLFRRGNTVLRIERDSKNLPSAIVFSVPRVRALRFQRTFASKPVETQ
jgi:hypothetical protein